VNIHAHAYSKVNDTISNNFEMNTKTLYSPTLQA